MNGGPPPCWRPGALVRESSIHLSLVADSYSPRRGWLPPGNTTFPSSNSSAPKTHPAMGARDPQLGPNSMSRTRRPPLFPIREREIQWANPSLQFPLPEALTHALKYLRAPLSSKDPAHWLSLCQKLTRPHELDYPIAPRWRTMMDPDWDFLPDRPSPLAVERATKQLSI